MPQFTLETFFLYYYRQVLLLTVGFIFCLTGLFIQKPEKNSTDRLKFDFLIVKDIPIPTVPQMVSLSFLGVGGLLFLSGMIWALFDRGAVSIVSPVPNNISGVIELPLIQSFEFEDALAVDPWVTIPDEKFTVQVSRDAAHTGSRSLVLQLDIRGNDTGDYGGIGLTGDRYPAFLQHSVAGSAGWVMIPKTSLATENNVYALMTGYAYNSNADYVQSSSKKHVLKPGVWTRIFWEPAYSVVQYDPEDNAVSRFNSPDRELSEFYITLWSDQPYSGLVYFDDIVFFQEEP